jgi:hypothetical protein
MDPAQHHTSFLVSRYGWHKPESDSPYYEFVVDDHEVEHLDRTPEETVNQQLQSVLAQTFDFARPEATTALAQRFETIGDVLAASEKELGQCDGVGPKTIEEIHARRSGELKRRLRSEPESVLVVKEDENGVFTPVYTPESVSLLRHKMIHDL